MSEAPFQMTCPRCGYKGTPNTFKDGFSGMTCGCLAFIMVLPAVLYYFLRQGKKICPQCKNVI
jgi:hypothetical protein